MRHIRVRRFLLTMAGAAALTLAVGACNPLDQNGTDPTPPPANGTDPTTGSPDNGTPPPDPGEATAPGTELAVGQTAVVPLGDGVVAVTVTSIEEGDQTAFQAEFEDVDGVTAYYAWATVENVSDEDFSFSSIPTVRGILDNGRTTGVILFGSSSGDCQRESFPADSGPGTVVETCNVVATRDSDDLGGVQWREDDYSDEPITWLR